MSNQDMDNISNQDMDNSNEDSISEISIEIINRKIPKSSKIEIFSVPYVHPSQKEKRILCNSFIKNTECKYTGKCAYAHSYQDQIINREKILIYQIFLDKNHMDFLNQCSNCKINEIYEELGFFTQFCMNCINNKCTGGYNCRNGAHNIFLKICKNDLFTGDCKNNTNEITKDKILLDKIKYDDFTECEKYIGCKNGHHLTTHGITPKFKYIHMKDSLIKKTYKSIRYIDLNPVTRLYNSASGLIINGDSDSSSNDDELYEECDEIISEYKKNIHK